MAQYASRASVNLQTHLLFRNKKSEEDGYILFVRQNALQVLIPKYGLEGTLYIRNEHGFTFDEDEPSQSKNDVKLKLFQKIKVQLSLDSSNIQHEKLELKLLEPFIDGFSVTNEEVTETETKKVETEPMEIESVKTEGKRSNLEESGKKTKKSKWRKMN